MIVLRCLTADTQCSAVSPTARPAVAHSCVSRQQGRLLLLSAGRRLPSVVVQAAVHSQRRCTTCILRQALGAHHSASLRASLAAGSGTDNIPSLRSDIPLSQLISAGIPRREHSSDSRRGKPPSSTVVHNNNASFRRCRDRSTLGYRAFPVAAPRAWNSLYTTISSNCFLPRSIQTPAEDISSIRPQF